MRVCSNCASPPVSNRASVCLAAALRVCCGQSSERNSPREAEPDATAGGGLRVAWPKELLSVEALKGDIRPGAHVYLGVQVLGRGGGVYLYRSVCRSTITTITSVDIV